MIFASTAYALPTVIDFQGRLMDNNNNPQAGTFNMTFTIYDASSGGNLLWTENKLVTVTGGLFSTLLGSVNAMNLTFNTNNFLEVAAAGETFSPRYQLATAPYAVRANISEQAIARTTSTTSFIISALAGQTSNLTEWRGSSGNTIASADASGNFNILRNLTVGSTTLFIDATIGRINITGDVYISKTQSGRTNGTLVLGYTSDGGENITFDESLGSNGKFRFSAPLQIAASSPGITFFDITDPTNTSKQKSIIFNSTGAYPISIEGSMEINGSLSVLGASPAAITFGGGANAQKLSFDQSSQEFQFSGGKIKQDFSNMIRNGGFESFSGGGTFTGGQQTAVPDAWVQNSGTVYQYAPSSYGAGSDIFQGYNSLQIDPTSTGQGKISQTIFAYRLQPNRTYSAGVWIRTSGNAIGRLNVTGSALNESFTEQYNSSGAWTLLKGKFGTKANVTSTDNITIELKVSGTSGNVALFDAVQMNSGGVLGEYQEAAITGVGDQTIYGGLRLQRNGANRGGILTVDKSIRTRQFEFTFGADPGWGGLNTDFMNDPRYDWAGSYSQANVILELADNNLLRFLSPVTSTSILTINISSKSGPILGVGTNQTILIASPVNITGGNLNVSSGNVFVTGSLVVNGSTVSGSSAANDNTTQANLITGNNNTLTAVLGQKLNLTGGTLNGNLIINSTGNANGTNSYNSSDFILQGSGVNYTNTSLNPNVTLRNIVTNAGSLNRLGIFVNETEQVSINSVGQVGIGTTSPNQLLHISSGNINLSSGNLFLTGALVVNGTTFTGSTAAGWSATANAVYNNSAGVDVSIGTNIPTARLTVAGVNLSNNVSLNVNNTLYVNGSGALAVGIGTANPTSTLHVVGTVNITGGLNVSAGGLNVISGNVGIGTTGPGQTLSVAGTFNATQSGASMVLNSNGDILVNLG